MSVILSGTCFGSMSGRSLGSLTTTFSRLPPVWSTWSKSPPLSRTLSPAPSSFSYLSPTLPGGPVNHPSSGGGCKGRYTGRNLRQGRGGETGRGERTVGTQTTEIFNNRDRCLPYYPRRFGPYRSRHAGGKSGPVCRGFRGDFEVSNHSRRPTSLVKSCLHVSDVSGTKI